MKRNNLKIIQIALFAIYLSISITILYLLLNYANFSFQNLSDKQYFNEFSKLLKNYFMKNYLLFTVIFIFLGLSYLFFLGFPLPLIILTSLIYGPSIGSVLSILFLSFSSFFIFLTYEKFFFKKIILQKTKISNQKYLDLLKKNQLKSVILFRLIGSVGIPFAAQNLLLCNLRLSKYIFFWGTFLGMLPGTIFTNYIVHYSVQFIFS